MKNPLRIFNLRSFRPSQAGTLRRGVRSTPPADPAPSSILRRALKHGTLAFIAFSSFSAAFADEATRNHPLTNMVPVVYVADFELAATDIKRDPAAPPAPPKLPGLLGRILPPPPGARKEPRDLVRDVVETMSQSVVKDLTKAGLTARRWHTGEPFPETGWLVRGAFTNVDQGNQLERSLIGLGKGKTEVQVLVEICDLSRGAPAAFAALTNMTAATSGPRPGAAPMLERHPAAVAGRLVMSGKDLDRTVKQAAAKVAEEVSRAIAGGRDPGT